MCSVSKLIILFVIFVGVFCLTNGFRIMRKKQLWKGAINTKNEPRPKEDCRYIAYSGNLSDPFCIKYIDDCNRIDCYRMQNQNCLSDSATEVDVAYARQIHMCHKGLFCLPRSGDSDIIEGYFCKGEIDNVIKSKKNKEHPQVPAYKSIDDDTIYDLEIYSI